MSNTLAANATEGKMYMVIGGWHWAKDKNLDKACKALMKTASFGSSKEIKAFIYIVPESCVLNDYGQFSWTKESPDDRPKDTEKNLWLRKRSYKID